jgi:hypothetical protein
VTEGQGTRVFDMPHARVTLTPVGPNVEIEVWPKAGQSAYVVVDPTVAILIARQLLELAAARIAATQLEAGEADEAAVDQMEPPDDGASEAWAESGPDNIVELASRRPSGGRAS